MAPQTEYTWRASPDTHPSHEITGVVTTGLLPSGAQLDATHSGSTSASMFLTSSPCSGGTALVVDPTGTVLWYEDLSQPGIQPAMVDVVHLTEEETVLGLISAYVVEVDWSGRERLVLTPGFDTGTTAHHDVFRRKGHTYTLFYEEVDLGGDTTRVDGFTVHDATGVLVATWRLLDHFTPPIPPVGSGGLVDYSHANSLFVQEDGDILISFRHLSTVAKIRGDWTAPDFGEILWRLAGDVDNAEMGSDFTLGSAGNWPGFIHQHHAIPLPDGRLSLFDNRKDLSQRSRVVVIDLDETRGEAQMDQVYELDRFCPFQGSSWTTEIGNPVATCATDGSAIEFDAQTNGAARFELSLGCSTGSSHFISRFVPFSL
jgi:hypothetical protein